MQAQDYAAGLWAVGQRTAGATRADVEAALVARAVVRTWPMRGTLHLVAAEDVRWLVGLLAPRVLKKAASRHRELALDAKVFAKARALLEHALAGGKALTRPELFEVLRRARIDPANQRGVHILGALAMERVVCSGALRDRQPTFALLEDWLPPAPTPTGDDALGTLAARYFTSHGPATVEDFIWWTGLTRTEATRALDIARPQLVARVVDDVTYWSGELATAKRGVAHLLSAWDELTVGYRDRSASVPAAYAKRSLNGLSPCVAVDGRIVGVWKRVKTEPTLALFAAVDAPVERAIGRAKARFAAYASS